MLTSYYDVGFYSYMVHGVWRYLKNVDVVLVHVFLWLRFSITNKKILWKFRRSNKLQCMETRLNKKLERYKNITRKQYQWCYTWCRNKNRSKMSSRTSKCKSRLNTSRSIYRKNKTRRNIWKSKCNTNGSWTWKQRRENL